MAAKKTTAKKNVRSAHKKAAVKKAASKKAPAKQRSRTTQSPRPSEKQVPDIVPGPPMVTAPPVEEPAVREIATGVVTHYYSDLGVAVVQVNTGTLNTGDTIRIKGHTTDMTQQLGSMELEHRHVDRAEPGDCVGIKVLDHVRPHDILFVVR